MTLENQPSGPAGAGDSAMLLAAMGILAYATSMMTHEALGHGGYCVAVGGHNAMLTGWGERCDFPGEHGAGIQAAGPGLQFGAGLASWFILRQLPSSSVHLRYFFWLCMVFDLLVSSGYLAFSGVTDSGDAAVVIAGLHPPFVWRGGLVLLGLGAYYLSMRAAARELKRLAGLDDGKRRLFRLVGIPYAAAGIFACCSAALNQTMGHGLAMGLAAASSFGAGFGLIGLPDMERKIASRAPAPTLYLDWSAAWGSAAAVVILVFLLFIGPGLTLAGAP